MHFLTNCGALRRYLQRETDMDTFTLSLQQPNQECLHKALQAYYMIYACLRWRATSNFTKVLREGRWVGRFISSAV